MTDTTAIIITKDEEKNIADCIDSINNFCTRILVIDSYSTDSTELIAKQHGAEVYKHKFETHAKQRNWAIENLNITTKWILRLDADERFTPELSSELSRLMEEHDSDNVNGITVEAWLYFLGRKIKHGCHNKRKLILFKTGKGYIEDRRMDEHTLLREGTSVYAKNRFIHYDFKGMDAWITKMNWYATNESLDYFDYLNGKQQNIEEKDKVILATRKKKFGVYYKLPIFLRCWLLFTYYYIFKLGFLDGKEGFVYHWMYHRWYRTLVDAKIFEHKLSGKPQQDKRRA